MIEILNKKRKIIFRKFLFLIFFKISIDNVRISTETFGFQSNKLFQILFDKIFVFI